MLIDNEINDKFVMMIADCLWTSLLVKLSFRLLRVPSGLHIDGEDVVPVQADQENRSV